MRAPFAQSIVVRVNTKGNNVLDMDIRAIAIVTNHDLSILDSPVEEKNNILN
jgi:hypothetical protein